MEGYFRTSFSRRVAMSMPLVPANTALVEPKKRCVCRTSFPPSRCLSSSRTAWMPSLPNSIAADNPAGPPPMMRTGTSNWGMGFISIGSLTSGSTGRPFSGITCISGFTSSMQDLTGLPSAMTMHWAHCPLAQKIPWGAPSWGW